MDDSQDMSAQFAERFASLPKVVQDAITSADVQKHMRDLAQSHKLHVDEWQVLENNVMLTLLGFQPVAEMATHLEKSLNITAEVAADLAQSISDIVFKPIRSEMEQSLSHPTAVQAAVSDVDTVRAQALAGESDMPAPPATTPASAPAVLPATPPAPAPEEKAIRAQIPETYASAASHERRSIEGDPYREQLS
ncbi:MAG: hypothetical protein KBD06_05200 [Candidatus Pacebacteria bacterium]|nr:hypothetical protein [Candidatus Paceibacterota bacterium]